MIDDRLKEVFGNIIRYTLYSLGVLLALTVFVTVGELLVDIASTTFGALLVVIIVYVLYKLKTKTD